jgi:hypothetical protein
MHWHCEQFPPLQQGLVGWSGESFAAILHSAQADASQQSHPGP